MCLHLIFFFISSLHFDLMPSTTFSSYFALSPLMFQLAYCISIQPHVLLFFYPIVITIFED